MKKKILALCLVVVLVATAITGVTLAYFTDYTDTAKNTFTVGNVDIELDETDTDDSTANADRDIENAYDDIFPGQTVVKDPIVTVKAGSEECYVRMFVTVDYEKLTKAFPSTKYTNLWEGNLFMLEELVVDADGNCTWDKATWPVAGVTYNEEDKTATYEFRYTGTVAEAETDTKLDALFENITFPAEMTNDEVAELDGFKVDIYADAIQAEGFDTADEAWTAFGSQADKTQQK